MEASAKGMGMSELLDNLKKLAGMYSKNLSEIREKISTLEDVPKAKALVGKFFKYQNGYNATEKLWLYKRITKSSGAHIWSDSFQEDSIGKIEFDFDKVDYLNSFYNTSGYIEISEEKYFSEQKKLISKLN